LSGHSDDGARGRFLRIVRDGDDLLSPRRCTSGVGGSAEQVGERSPLAYDAAILIIDAVQNLAGRLRREEWDPYSIDPVAVHAEMFGQYSVIPAEPNKKYTEKPFDGVSGSVWFDLSGVPVNKRISLLEIQDITSLKRLPTEVFHCGIARAGDDPACGKPQA